MRSVRRLAVALLGLLPLAACGHPTNPPAAAPPRAGQSVLTIGIVPEEDIFRQLRRYEPLAAYLTNRVGVRLRLVPLSRYDSIIESFQASSLDGAFFGSFSYALAHRQLGLEVLARPELPDGSSTYYGVVFVRQDRGIKNAMDLRGKRFAFVDRATTAGYLLPLDYLIRSGAKDPARFLGEFYFAGTHEDAIRDVLDGKADAGAAKNTVLDRVARDDPRVKRDLVVLDRSPDVPENALAVRGTVDAGLRRALKETLLAMAGDAEGRTVLEQFGARRFIETTDADYEPVYRYAREVGLDLMKYEYRKK